MTHALNRSATMASLKKIYFVLNMSLPYHNHDKPLDQFPGWKKQQGGRGDGGVGWAAILCWPCKNILRKYIVLDMQNGNELFYIIKLHLNFNID